MFAIGADGTLRVGQARLPDVNGPTPLTVKVKVTDAGGLSHVENVTVTVTPIENAPPQKPAPTHDAARHRRERHRDRRLRSFGRRQQRRCPPLQARQQFRQQDLDQPAIGRDQRRQGDQLRDGSGPEGPGSRDRPREAVFRGPRLCRGDDRRPSLRRGRHPGLHQERQREGHDRSLERQYDPPGRHHQGRRGRRPGHRERSRYRVQRLCQQPVQVRQRHQQGRRVHHR